jgi:3-oxoacyl-[acyl-carrier protein] reductase
MHFDNKVVLVTGAAGGIGQAIAHNFARQGAKVAVHYRSSRAAADKLLKELPGKDHHGFAADLTDAAECKKLMDGVGARYGRLDILVNNAAIYEVRPLKDLDYSEWQATWVRTLAANLIAPANLCFLAAKLMQKQGGGKIINISSRGAYRGEPEAVAYGASKAGLNQLTQSLAQALAPHNIFVAAVAPGFVYTDMAKEILDGPKGAAIKAQSPLNRVAETEEVAEAVVRLAQEGMMFATGAILDLNGASYLR